MDAVTFKTVTLNCWGIPVFSRNRFARINAIADWLLTSEYDFVFLQELWLPSDFDLIRGKLIKIFPYAHYFRSGVFGSGICILSRHTILSALFHPCAVNGFPHKIQHGDWLGGKGVGFCKVRVAQLNVHLYATHLHAKYDNTNDIYECHRAVQSFSAAQFVRATVSDAHVVVFAGDFNATATELPIRLAKYCAAVLDVYDMSSVNWDLHPGTYQNSANTYARVDQCCAPHYEGCIDHILVSVHSGGGRRVSVAGCEYSLPLTGLLVGGDEGGHSYSDHEAVAAKLTLNVESITTTSVCDEEPLPLAPQGCWRFLLDAQSLCQSYVTKLQSDQIWYYRLSLLLVLLVFATLLLPDLPFSALPSCPGLLGVLLRFPLTLLCGYTLFMATIWNRMECAAIVAALDEITVAAKHVPNE